METKQRIFRSSKDGNYTVVKNTFIDDSRLSGKDKGILIVSLRLRDDWKISAKVLSRFMKDGEDSILSSLKKLAEYGYAEYRIERDPETGRLDGSWYVWEESKTPEIAREASKTKLKQKTNSKAVVHLQEAESSPILPGTEIPGAGNSPDPESPGPVKPDRENTGHINTKEQVLSNQVLLEQKQQTSREYKSAPAKIETSASEIARSEPLPYYKFPNFWLMNFQDYYEKVHGSEMGHSLTDLKALNELFETSKGNWTLVESKIKTLIQLRKKDPNFWYNQAVSPESVSKFWSRLFEREVTEKKRCKERTGKFEKRETIREVKKEQRPPKEENKMEYVGRNSYECFLEWGRKNLFPAQLEYFTNNKNPETYTGSKKILFEKFKSEIYANLKQAANTEKPKSENIVEITKRREVA
ncbi:helix-turn-helix domain-containing protein [Leptospira barantonii]|uniref:Helix-turn-helix domain-containing protein n=1 Tax=Leptospira barantonii TaxID=2023184 RepID=A0A5F2BKC1_9LEPT|nr:helix-turn-helix domain-containing protein [Leptospira barantonii]TGM06005.1 helix-turn-helix domain-containing protein [Leptospira barantonii]